MSHVAIVGAGPLGGDLAFVLARRDLVSTITLVDGAGLTAAGKALDIRQSAPVEGFATHVTGASDLSVAVGAPIVVLADRAGGIGWEDDTARALLRRFLRRSSSTIVVGAEAGHRDLIERTVREDRVDPRRIIGSAPQGLASAVRAVTAAEADRSPQDVALAVLGIPPERLVIPWDDATIAGLAAVRVLDEPARRRIMRRAARLWPPGRFTLAAAAADVVAALVGRSRATPCVFVAPDLGIEGRVRVGAMPVRLGPNGVERVETLTLSTHDQVALDTALLR